VKNLKLTLKAWPVITIVTIGLCFLTQCVAKIFGVNLPDQANVELVRNVILHMFDTGKNFISAAFLILQVIVLLPILEEFLFRYLLVRLPLNFAKPKFSPRILFYTEDALAILSSILFSAAHYITQPFPDSAFVALFFFGVAQCALYKRTKNIWCAALNHALFNLTNLVLAVSIPEMG
jgi:membrane protease YdiL (CAAX protease family)